MAPDGLREDSKATWTAWMRSWAAANWQPADLPGLTVTIQLWDQCQRAFEDPYVEKDGRRGETMFVLRPNPTTELRQYMDNYGISPKGQQDRRWVAPKVEDPVAGSAEAPSGDRYGHLRAI